MNLGPIHFLRPEWLWLLPLLAVLIWWLRRPGGDLGAWRRIADPRLLEFLTSGRSGRQRRWPLVLLALGWVLATLALSGPAWEQRPLPLYQSGAVKVVVLDLSRSMLAPDLKPNRLTQARYKLADLLDRTREGQIGLVAYAGESFVVSPLTDDSRTIKSMLGALDTNIMPVQGSELGEALTLASQLLAGVDAVAGEVLVISDSVGVGALEAARELLAAGHRISVLGVGTAEGAPIPQENGGFFKTADGEIAVPRLDEPAMAALAEAGGGRYVRLRSDATDLDLLEREPVNTAPSDSEPGSQEALRWREEGPWLVLLLLPLAALAFRRGWLLALPLAVLLLPPAPAVAGWWDDAWQTRDQQAAESLAAGAPEDAAQLAEDPMLRGESLYRSGDYEAAVNAFAAGSGPDAHYNRGNALAQLEKYQEAIDAYDRALASDPEMADAQHNKDLLEELLKQQEQQQQQDNQESDEQSDGESEQQSDQSSEQEGEEEQREPQGSEQSEGEEQEEETQAAVAEELDAEEKQSLEQWLRRIPDDPGGLLRRKFLLEYQRRGQPKPVEDEQW
ncbi:MAG: VWA domain-containing protein [Pseudomonadota bacterium]